MECKFCHEDLSEFDEENRQNHEKSCQTAEGFLRKFYGQYQCMKCTKFISGSNTAYNHVKSHFSTTKKPGPKSAKRKREDKENEPECKRRKESDALQNHENESGNRDSVANTRENEHEFSKESEDLEESQNSTNLQIENVTSVLEAKPLESDFSIRENEEFASTPNSAKNVPENSVKNLPLLAKNKKNQCIFCGKIVGSPKIHASTLYDYKSKHRQMCEIFLGLFDNIKRECKICMKVVRKHLENHFDKLHPDRLFPQQSRRNNQELGNDSIEIQELTSTPEKSETPKSPKKSVKDISVEIEIPSENNENSVKSTVEIPKEVSGMPDIHKEIIELKSENFLGFCKRFEEKTTDKSFLSDTSGLGSISVSGTDGEVTTIWKCPFCKKKYLSRQFVVNHLESPEIGGHNMSVKYLTTYGLEIKCAEI